MTATSLPAIAGIGLRAVHHQQVLASRPNLGWVEVHSENFFAAGGEPLRVLEAVRRDYPVSLHGVGLSIGCADALSRRHLDKLAALVERIQPAAVSDHLCWSGSAGRYLNDLLPIPYTRAALDLVCRHVDQAQTFLKRPLLVENVSSYIQFAGAELSEWHFLAQLAQRTGCGILLDVNNVYVSSRNHGFDAMEYLSAMPAQQVGEIHLAGYEEADGFLVDSHSRPVHGPVWQLYEQALALLGPRPTLIEWDNDIPPLATLLAEKAQADRRLARQASMNEVSHVRAA